MFDNERNGRITRKQCGIIMPISANESCSAEHWSEVFTIIADAVNTAGYEANLVSNSDDSGIIQKRIVRNLYDNEIVVCDVSCKNPNVMFELGMRLAFDKPTIIVIDDKTDYSFDTGVIEHISYPRDLRFKKIVEFKKKLKEKIIATVKKSKEDPEYTTFLKNFGEFMIADLQKTTVSKEEFIVSKLEELSEMVQRITMHNREATSSYTAQDLDREMRINDIIMDRIDNFLSEYNITFEDLLNNLAFKNKLKETLVTMPELRLMCGTSGNILFFLSIVLKKYNELRTFYHAGEKVKRNIKKAL